MSAETIMQRASIRCKELKSMPREKLATLFEEIYGSAPHPKFLIDFLAISITRHEQRQMWIDETGSVPDDIVARDIKFWDSRTMHLLTKDGLKNERAQELARGKRREVRITQQETKSSEGILDSTLRLTVKDNPYSESFPDRASIIDILLTLGGRAKYGDVEKSLKKKHGNRVNLAGQIHMIKRDGHLIIDVPSSTIERRETIEIEEEVRPAAFIVAKLKQHACTPRTAILGQPNYPTSGSTSHSVAGNRG